jgi:hypothetical protein
MCGVPVASFYFKIFQLQEQYLIMCFQFTTGILHVVILSFTFKVQHTPVGYVRIMSLWPFVSSDVTLTGHSF